MADNLVAQIFRIFLFQSETVVFSVLVPLFQTDYEVDILCLADTRSTEQRLDVHNTNTAQLDKVLCDIRCSSDQCFLTDLADLYNIVRYQTVSSLNQLKRRLGFTDSALACNQDAFAIYVNQYAVNRNAGCQLDIQPTDQLCRKRTRRTLGHQKRNAFFNGNLPEQIIRMQLTTENNAGDRVIQKLLQHLLLFFFRHSLNIRVFYESNHLQTGRLKVFKIARHRKCRSVDIRQRNLNPLQVDFRSQIFQLHFFCNLH